MRKICSDKRDHLSATDGPEEGRNLIIRLRCVELLHKGVNYSKTKSEVSRGTLGSCPRFHHTLPANSEVHANETAWRTCDCDSTSLSIGPTSVVRLDKFCTIPISLRPGRPSGKHAAHSISLQVHRTRAPIGSGPRTARMACAVDASSDQNVRGSWPNSNRDRLAFQDILPGSNAFLICARVFPIAATTRPDFHRYLQQGR
jgi:hypothetical protein